MVINANIHGRSQSTQSYATSATISGTKFGPVSFWAWLCNYNASQSSITFTGLFMTTFVGYVIPDMLVTFQKKDSDHENPDHAPRPDD